MNFIEFEEETDHRVSEALLSDDTARAITDLPGAPIALEPPSFLNDRNYVLRSNGCVGVIPIGNDLTLRISPKVPVLNVFRMLEYAYDLRSFLILEGTNRSASLKDLFETLALILARKVLDRVRKGLHRDYVEDTDSLVVPRGRILLAESIVGRLRGRVRLDCVFDDHTPDLDDNRILAWTLHQIRRCNLERPDVKRAVRDAYRAMSAVVDIRPVVSKACIGRLYDRLNSDYRPMHGLCRFFLSHCGPAIGGGEHEFLPFRVDMPALFEAFVERWLRRSLPPSLHLDSQFQAIVDERNRYRFVVDLVISEASSGKALAVLDTKYKRDRKLASGDLEQIVAYAARMGTAHAFLIYPSPKTESEEFGWSTSLRVHTTTFDIGADLEIAGRRFLRGLLTAVTPGAVTLPT